MRDIISDISILDQRRQDLENSLTKLIIEIINKVCPEKKITQYDFLDQEKYRIHDFSDDIIKTIIDLG